MKFNGILTIRSNVNDSIKYVSTTTTVWTVDFCLQKVLSLAFRHIDFSAVIKQSASGLLLLSVMVVSTESNGTRRHEIDLKGLFLLLLFWSDIQRTTYDTC